MFEKNVENRLLCGRFWNNRNNLDSKYFLQPFSDFFGIVFVRCLLTHIIFKFLKEILYLRAITIYVENRNEYRDRQIRKINKLIVTV